MSDVVNRDTLEFRRSVDRPLWPDPPWKHDPDMSAVAGVPVKYQKWDGGADRPVEMTQAEKDAVDAAEAQALEDAEMGRLNLKDALTALALVVLDEINTLRTDPRTTLPAYTVAQLKTAIRDKYRSL
jgi:hypothetical protein